MASALRAKSDEGGAGAELSGMTFSSLLCAANPALELASWCHCAAVLGNPQLPLPRRMPGYDCSDLRPLMGPGFGAPKCEIVGVGGSPARRHLRFNHLIGNALALAIGHGFFLGVEVKGDLLLHVAGGGTAHQRLAHAV